MARILICWELGAGYGHLARLAPVARALAALGHEVSVAARDVLSAHAMLGGFAIHQAPIRLKGTALPGAALNYADILMRSGLSDGPAITALIAAWRALFDALSPDLIVADHAPTALLAARAGNRKAAALGTGFAVPPPLNPMPTVLPWRQVDGAALEQAEARFLAAANEALTGLDAAPLNAVADLFDVAAALPCTWPELDHYADRPDRGHPGPVMQPTPGAAPEWPAGGDGRIFAYLSGEHPATATLLERLADMNKAAVVHIRNATPALTARLSKAGGPVRIYAEKIDAAAALAACDIVVTHGGHGLISAALAAGRPILSLPGVIEQAMLSFRVAKAGFGLVPPRAGSPGDAETGFDYGRAVEVLTTDARFADNVKTMRDRYADVRPEDTLEQIVRALIAAL